MTITLYGFPASANTHRVRAFLSILGLPFEERLVNLVTGEQRLPEFLKLSPAGQVPILMDESATVFDSHAILIYLAEKYDAKGTWWPKAAIARAEVLSWMFFDANELHNGIGWSRNHVAFRVPGDPVPFQQRGRSALKTLEARLGAHPWLALDQPTLADVTCVPLVALCHEAGLSLEHLPAVRGWVERVQGVPRFPTMPSYG
ncbi:MAG: glutathione S-transferase family protein [Sulfuritalea sp.]|nr:glutathione S-transferase family protein [Sulfuritalea sp.]